MLGIQNLNPFDGDRNTENLVIPSSDVVCTGNSPLSCSELLYGTSVLRQPGGAQVVHSLGSPAVLQDSW